MLIALVFFGGVLNFAANKAVLESHHPLLDSLPKALRSWGGRAPLVAEYTVLFAALALVAYGFPATVWVYGGYTLFNLGSAWAILTGRI